MRIAPNNPDDTQAQGDIEAMSPRSSVLPGMWMNYGNVHLL